MPLLDLSTWDPVPCRCRSQLNLKPQRTENTRMYWKLNAHVVDGIPILLQKNNLGVSQGWAPVLRSPYPIYFIWGDIPSPSPKWQHSEPPHSCRWQLCKVVRLHLSSHGFCFGILRTNIKPRGKAMQECYTIPLQKNQSNCETLIFWDQLDEKWWDSSNPKDHFGLPSNDAEGSRFGQVRFVDAVDGQWHGTRNCLYPNMAGCTMSWN